MTEEKDFVYIRFRMKKDKFEVYQAEANEINDKYNLSAKITGTSLIKALADDNADVKLQINDIQIDNETTGKPIYNSFGEVTGYQ